MTEKISIVDVDRMKIQHDGSGVGHNWQTVSHAEINPDHLAQIYTEAIETKHNCGEINCGGQHYRWAVRRRW